MEKELNFNDMLTGANTGNKNEHLNEFGWFRKFHFTEKTVIQSDNNFNNVVLFLIKGNMEISLQRFNKKFLCSNNIVFISKASFVKIELEPDTIFLTLIFRHLLNFDDLDLLKSHDKYYDQVKNELPAISIVPPMIPFLDMLSYYLDNEVMSKSWHKLMSRQFFLLIKDFYSKQDVIKLLYPVSNDEIEFKFFILKNYNNVHSIEELISLSKMSRSAFFTKFKKVFNTTAKQWMLKQNAYRLLKQASKPGMNLKKLLEVCDFDSLSQLNRYVKKTFNCTPKELIVRPLDFWKDF